jgi:acyl carrier protein
MLEAKQITSERAGTEARVLKLIRELLSELGSERALRAVNLQASLARDLGIGSLERVELLLRLEKEFSIRLADRVMTEAETPLELVNALLRHDFSQTEGLSWGLPICSMSLRPRVLISCQYRHSMNPCGGTQS